MDKTQEDVKWELAGPRRRSELQFADGNVVLGTVPSEDSRLTNHLAPAVLHFLS